MRVLARGVLGAAAVTLALAAPAGADVLVAGPQEVQGGICVGFDCINNEVFGDQTLILKENNTRIGFLDQSGAGAPSEHWEVTANDSASSGLNYLAFNDVTAARLPLLVIGGAPTDALRVEPTGALSTGAGLLVEAGASTAATPVDGAALLAALKPVPLSTYRYAGAQSVVRLGLLAPAFNTAAGTGGADQRLVATSDLAGAVLAVLKRVDAEITARDGHVPAGAAGTPGAAGAKGADGARGAAGTSGPDAGALAKLQRRIAALDTSQKRLAKQQSALGKRVTTDRRRAGG